MTIAPIPQVPDSVFEQRAAVVVNGQTCPLSKLTTKGRKLAWQARMHPRRKGAWVRYIPAHRLDGWHLGLGALWLSSVMASRTAVSDAAERGRVR